MEKMKLPNMNANSGEPMEAQGQVYEDEGEKMRLRLVMNWK